MNLKSILVLLLVPLFSISALCSGSPLPDFEDPNVEHGFHFYKENQFCVANSSTGNYLVRFGFAGEDENKRLWVTIGLITQVSNSEDGTVVFFSSRFSNQNMSEETIGSNQFLVSGANNLTDNLLTNDLEMRLFANLNLKILSLSPFEAIIGDELKITCNGI